MCYSPGGTELPASQRVRSCARLAFPARSSCSRRCWSKSLGARESRVSLRRSGSQPRSTHGAAIARKGRSEWDLVRPGIFLYGVGSGRAAGMQPEPVVHLRAPIVEIRNFEVGDTVGYGATFRAQRPARIATLAVGYADGYPR